MSAIRTKAALDEAITVRDEASKRVQVLTVQLQKECSHPPEWQSDKADEDEYGSPTRFGTRTCTLCGKWWNTQDGKITE